MVTSADVAKRAGVSRATVSYVLNDAPNQTISAPTREAVHRAARELGYRPNAAASSLRKGRGVTVLLPLPGQHMTHVITSLVDACSTALTRRGLTLVSDFTDYATADERLQAWLRLHPAAVIDVFVPRDDPAVHALRRAGVAVLLPAGSGGTEDEPPADAIAFQGREAQVSYLLGRGHRRVVLAAPRIPSSPANRRGMQRLRRAARAAGATLPVAEMELSHAAVHDAVDGWLRGQGAPDAVAAYNDDYAIAVLAALARRGVRVPEDVAVMGVDDSPLGAAVSPSLTTVAWDFDAFGDSIAAATTALVRDGAAEQQYATPVANVVVRESA